LILLRRFLLHPDDEQRSRCARSGAFRRTHGDCPAQYRHPHNGTFILTTVFSHAPILVGEWMLAQVDPAMKVVAPETVVPKKHNGAGTGKTRLSNAG